MRNACLAISAILALAAGAATAQDVVVKPFDGSFEDATFAVESAITNQGLVVDHVSKVGEMLARTGADVGSDKTIFAAADVFLFCSAVVSRQVMEADPMNIAYCPYGIFVAQTGEDVQIGYRTYPVGPMDAVETLLDAIVTESVGE